METIPKELEETPLNLEVIVDPKTKCVTMKTHMIETPPTRDAVIDIIPEDPFQEQIEEDEPDISNMNELEKLIYTERQRILNVKELSKLAAKSKTKDKDTNSSDREADASSSGMSDIESYQKLTPKEKSKLRMRKIRKRETSEENDLRKFRSRIVTTKMRLLKKLQNFDNESYLKEITKSNTDKIRQKRKNLKETETPEQRKQRKSTVNSKSRLAKIRRKAFKTPEEILIDKEKRLASLEKYWARHTEEERRARQKIYRDKTRERYRKNISEWKKYDMILKGVPLEEIEKS